MSRLNKDSSRKAGKNLQASTPRHCVRLDHVTSALFTNTVEATEFQASVGTSKVVGWKGDPCRSTHVYMAVGSSFTLLKSMQSFGIICNARSKQAFIPFVTFAHPEQ